MKKKLLKKTAYLLVFVMVAGLSAGCSGLPDFDASKYVEAVLNARYKGDSALAEELGIATKEEVDAMYTDTLNETASAIFTATGMKASDELTQRYRDIYREIFTKMDYTVKDSQKLADGSYGVTVTYRQMKVYEPTVKKAKKNLNKLNTTDPQLALESIFTIIADGLEKTLSKDLEYGIEEVMVIHVEVQDHKYVLNMEDVSKLTKSMIDSGEANMR